MTENIGGIDFSVTIKADQVNPTLKDIASSVKTVSAAIESDLDRATTAATQRIETLTVSLRMQAETWKMTKDQAKEYADLQNAIRSGADKPAVDNLQRAQAAIRNLREEDAQRVQNEIKEAARDVDRERRREDARNRDIQKDIEESNRRAGLHQEAIKQEQNTITDRENRRNAARQRDIKNDVDESNRKEKLYQDAVKQELELQQLHDVQDKQIRSFSVTSEQRQAEAIDILNAAMKRGSITLAEYDHNLALIARNQGLAFSNQRGIAGDVTRTTFAVQQLAFGLQDATSVYGLTGFSGAVRAASNNVIQFASLISPGGTFGIAAALAAVPIGLIADHFAKTKEEAKKATVEVEALALAIGRVKDLSEVRKTKTKDTSSFEEVDKDRPDSVRSFVNQKKRARKELEDEITADKEMLTALAEEAKKYQHETYSVETEYGAIGTPHGGAPGGKAMRRGVRREELEPGDIKSGRAVKDSKNVIDDKEALDKNTEEAKKTRPALNNKEDQLKENDRSTKEGELAYRRSFIEAIKKENAALMEEAEYGERSSDAKLIARMETEKFTEAELAEARAIAAANEAYKEQAKERAKQKSKEEAKQNKASGAVENWTERKDALEIELTLLKAHGSALDENTHHAQRLAEIERMKRDNIDPKVIKAAEEKDKELTPLENQKKVWQESKNVVKEFEDPLVKLTKRQKDLNEMLSLGAINAGEYQQALQGAYAQARKDYTIRAGLQRAEANEVGSAADTAALYNQMELARAGLLPGGRNVGGKGVPGAPQAPGMGILGAGASQALAAAGNGSSGFFPFAGDGSAPRGGARELRKQAGLLRKQARQKNTVGIGIPRRDRSVFSHVPKTTGPATGKASRGNLSELEKAYRRESAEQKMQENKKKVLQKGEPTGNDNTADAGKMLEALQMIVKNTDMTQQNTVTLKPLGVTA